MSTEATRTDDARTLEERIAELFRRLGIEPRALPAPPDDAPEPPRPWSDTDADDDERRTP